MSKKLDKLNEKRGNALFRHGFKKRQEMDMKVVDKHFGNLCHFAKEIDEKIGHSISVLTPSGIIHYERKLIDMTFSFQRIKGRKAKGKKKK